MTLLELRSQFLNDLKKIYPKTEILSFYFLLIEYHLGLKKVDISLFPEKELTAKESELIFPALHRLKKEEPVQYILGETEFYGLNFKVDRNVLIPRPETEELVDWIIKDSSESQDLKILDIGTGSGCIAISLAKHLPNAEVYALDISKKALQVAEYNANHNKVSIQFIEQDILRTNVSLKGVENLEFDIIVSNPPYVRESEKEAMKKNVLAFEPHSALFVDDTNPILFYEAIVKLAKKNLRKEGKLFFEINQYLSNEITQMLEKNGFSQVEPRKDLFGNDRMIKVTIKNF
ncbi:MAG: peptide chain release factor N(5)-glutamine methyltransferase [Flavobacteriaceae bacterium]|nr:peptide chain release factor N(5)-glutamine methyltransferase [Flavobacteriaceae bacterium]